MDLVTFPAQPSYSNVLRILREVKRGKAINKTCTGCLSTKHDRSIRSTTIRVYLPNNLKTTLYYFSDIVIQILNVLVFEFNMSFV